MSSEGTLITPPQRPAVPRILSAIALAWLFAASAHASISVQPPFPSSSDPIWIFLVAADSPSSPPALRCIEWTISPARNFEITIAGHLIPPPTCPPIEQLLSLGQLPDGHYRVDVTIDGQPGVFNSVTFDVASSQAWDPSHVDLALSPSEPRAGQPSELVLSDFEDACAAIDWQPPVVIGSTVQITGNRGFFGDICPVQPRIEGHRFALPPLTGGMKTIEVRTSGYPLLINLDKKFHVREDDPLLQLQGNRFRATLSYKDRAGVVHNAVAAPLTDDSGFFWFFADSNAEVTMKLLDGRAVNGHYWVFVSSMTDLAFTLSVVDDGTHCLELPTAPPTCPARVYQQAAGKNRNFIDTSAF
jgi:hypothetical protein